MSAFAEFVGGPYDGKILELPDGRTRWYVSAQPMPGSWLASESAEPPMPLEPLLYEAVSRRTFDAPTGERVLRFVLR